MVLCRGTLREGLETRRLLRVTIDNVEETDRVLTELMGKDVEARFKFIMERAALADLDL